MKFNSGDTAEIHSTTSAELDGQKVIIRGITFRGYGMYCYIIELERPIVDFEGFYNTHIQLTEHCLK